MTKRYNLKDIKEMILKIHDLNDLMDLNRFVIKNIKAQRWIAGQVTKSDLSLGRKVEWTGKRGAQKGFILKLNRTRALVENEIGEKWNVPFHMLTISK